MRWCVCVCAFGGLGRGKGSGSLGRDGQPSAPIAETTTTSKRDHTL